MHKVTIKQPGPGVNAVSRINTVKAKGATSRCVVRAVSQHDPRLSPEQLAFEERKRKAACGEGPLFPPESSCPSCNGLGTLVCNKCHGRGLNSQGVEEIMGSQMEDTRARNGLLDTRMLLMKDGPCWKCMGRITIGCSDCGGTGIKGGVDRFTGD